MNAILLAAGFGTRLRPITDSVPKCLVQINERTLLDIWLDFIFKSPLIEKVLINSHYLHEVVYDHLLNSPHYEKIKLVHEKKLLGTGGTILKNYNFIGDSAFFVAHADNLTKFDLEDFINFHKNRKDGILITMMTFQTPNPESCGIVEVDKYGIVTAFHEKVQNPPGNIANGAIYIFEKEIVDYMKLLNKTEFDISLDIIPNFLGKIQTYMNHRYHRDIGTLDSLKAAQFDFNDRY